MCLRRGAHHYELDHASPGGPPTVYTFATPKSPERLAWAKRREELFGFRPDPDMPAYPFHPESRNTAVAVIEADRSGVRRAGFVPCWIDDEARPVPVGGTEEGDGVTAYVADITRRAGLDTTLRPEGVRVWIDLAP